MNDHDPAPAELATRLETRLADESASLANASEWEAGQRLGPYHLKRLLGQGGMGVVWLADQIEPLEREIALKLLRIQREKPLLEAYFEVERQALARLTHPNIAQIHDAGRLGDHALYFAMEYVPGQPLNRFNADRQLSWRTIAELMIKVCAGVHYAHQRGLIHRDLKPANILVNETAEGLLPKIIDFGIAVSTTTGIAGGNQTGRGGTAAYMPPEQHAAGGGDIDARADVYALGAILSELLYRGPGRRANFSVLSGEERCMTLALALGKASGTVEQRIRTMADGFDDAPLALIAVAHKALSQDPDGRYDSASALADDLRAWLHHRPVSALGHSRGYALRCFVRRNRVGTAAAVLVSLSLVAGMLTALHGLDQARQARQIADQRRADAEGLVQFMLGDFAENLRPIGRLDLLDEVGQQAMEYLARQARDDDPQTVLNRARALKTLGEVQVTRQQFELAQQSLGEARALVQPWLAGDSALRADFLFESGNIEFWLGAVAYRVEDFESTERHWRNYLDRAETLVEVAPEDPRGESELGYAYNNLGTLAEQRGRLADALDYFQRVAQLRRKLVASPDDPAVLDLANTLSWTSRIQRQLGHPVAASTTLEEALSLVTEFRSHSEDARALIHEATLRDLVGSSSYWQGDHERARDEWVRSLQLQEQVVANDPTRPRRRAALARTAYMLVRNPLTTPEQVERWMARAEEIRNELQSEDGPDDRFLDVHHCISALTLPRPPEPQSACLASIWPETREVIRASDADERERELAVEFALALNRVYPDQVTAAQLAEAESALATSADDGHQTLSRLQLRRALVERSNPASDELTAIDRQIQRLLSE
ncbi:MAG: serine/threonine-protein kinase [Wenzhouxiangellaceae bacterium]|nr:serine/threonine-protein kinase [Wenzhouxiangellaceae bacterium]